MPGRPRWPARRRPPAPPAPRPRRRGRAAPGPRGRAAARGSPAWAPAGPCRTGHLLLRLLLPRSSNPTTTASAQTRSTAETSWLSSPRTAHPCAPSGVRYIVRADAWKARCSNELPSTASTVGVDIASTLSPRADVTGGPPRLVSAGVVEVLGLVGGVPLAQRADRATGHGVGLLRASSSCPAWPARRRPRPRPWVRCPRRCRSPRRPSCRISLASGS